jgi:hypothetical protein
MWWTGEEEQLQKQAEAAWGDPADDDIADPAADPFDQPAEDAGLVEEVDAADEGEPPAAFPWHIPEGMPLPVAAPELPMVNGYHIFLPPLTPPMVRRTKSRTDLWVPWRARGQFFLCAFA